MATRKQTGIYIIIDDSITCREGRQTWNSLVFYCRRLSFDNYWVSCGVFISSRVYVRARVLCVYVRARVYVYTCLHVYMCRFLLDGSLIVCAMLMWNPMYLDNLKLAYTRTLVVDNLTYKPALWKANSIPCSRKVPFSLLVSVWGK